MSELDIDKVRFAIMGWHDVGKDEGFRALSAILREVDAASADLAAARERIAALEREREWEPVESIAELSCACDLDCGGYLTLILGNRLTVKSTEDTVVLPQDYRLMRRRPQPQEQA